MRHSRNDSFQNSSLTDHTKMVANFANICNIENLNRFIQLGIKHTQSDVRNLTHFGT